MRICVMTYRKANGEELPSAFHLGGRRLPILSILERWSEGSARYYEVCVDDGRRFVLRHSTERCFWELAAVYAAARPRTQARPGTPRAGALTPAPLSPKIAS